MCHSLPVIVFLVLLVSRPKSANRLSRGASFFIEEESLGSGVGVPSESCKEDLDNVYIVAIILEISCLAIKNLKGSQS